MESKLGSYITPFYTYVPGSQELASFDMYCKNFGINGARNSSADRGNAILKDQFHPWHRLRGAPFFSRPVQFPIIHVLRSLITEELLLLVKSPYSFSN